MKKKAPPKPKPEKKEGCPFQVKMGYHRMVCCVCYPEDNPPGKPCPGEKMPHHKVVCHRCFPDSALSLSVQKRLQTQIV